MLLELILFIIFAIISLCWGQSARNSATEDQNSMYFKMWLESILLFGYERNKREA